MEDRVRWHGSADIRRLREFEEENRRLKQMYGEFSLENRALKDAHKKVLKPAVKRELIAGLRAEHQVSEGQACKVVSLRRSVYRYRARPNRDQ